MLPSGYKKLTHITSTGTQYINTRVKATVTSSVHPIIKIKCKPTDSSANQIFFGTLNSAVLVLQIYNSTRLFQQFGQRYYLPNEDNDYHTYIFDYVQNKIFIDNVEFTSIRGDYDNGRMPLFLFGCNDGGSLYQGLSGSIAEFSYDDGNQHIELEAALRESDNEAGMFDTVSNTFFPNLGAGSFIAGDIIPTQVTSYKTTMFSSRLPSGYTELKSITNNNGTVLNTGVTCSDNMEFYIRFKCNTLSSLYILQRRTSAVTAINGISGSSSGATILGNFQSGRVQSSITRTVNHIYQIRFAVNNGNLALYVKDETADVEATETSSYTISTIPQETVKMFGNDSGDRLPSGCVVYDAYIKKDGVYAWQCVPAKQDSRVGVYNLATNTFITPSSGSLTGGAEVTTAVDCYKSVMFNRRLPAGYTELEYIESTGTQYIDTGINPAGKKIGAVVDFQFTNISGLTGGVFGSNKTDGTDNCQFTVYTSKWRIKINSYATYGTNYNTSRHTARLNMSDGTRLDDTVYTTTQYTVASSNNTNCYLGACNYNNGSSTSNYTLIGKLYSAQVYDDTTLVRNFIPAKNSSNVIGMYDTVTSTFFTNAGSGTFTAGSELPSLIPVTSYKSVMFN